MNTAKKNIVLLVVLIVQVALIAFLYRPGQNVAPSAANIFTSLAPEKVTAMTITDDQGKTVSLAKKDGAWQLSQGEFPADQAKIEELIKKFADSKSSRLVSQTAASHARLKVADTDFNRKVELVQGDAKTVFYLGTAPSAKSIHLRLADAKEVYQVNDLSSWQVQAEKEMWWQARYFSQPLDTIKGLTIVNANGTVALIKEGDKEWRLVDKPETALDSKRIETLLGSVSEIDISSYQDKGFTPKAKPVVTVTYQTKDGTSTLQIWAKDKAEDQDLLVKASSSAFYAKAKEYGVKEAMEVKAETLIIAQPVSEDAASAKADAGGAAPELLTDHGVPAIPPPVTTPPDK